MQAVNHFSTLTFDTIFGSSGFTQPESPAHIFSTPGPQPALLTTQGRQNYLNSLNVGNKEPITMDELTAGLNSFQEEEEIEQPLEELTPESIALESADASMLGAVAAAGANSLANSQATQDVNRDLNGQGVAGSSFGASFQARADASHDQTVGIENVGMIAGSAFLGPEALAGGLIAAGLNSAFNSAPVATVQSNLGTQVPVSDMQ